MYDEEYFCPNCGAILNNQYGFDPNKGYWKCTSCSKLLIDDETYDGDTYEGIAWFCDNCGALLNKQDGFTDSYGSWDCSTCGYTNKITEDDILDDDDEGILKCPSCGIVLNNQRWFNRYDDDWTCTSCGAHLHHEYSYEDYEIIDDDDSNQKNTKNIYNDHNQNTSTQTQSKNSSNDLKWILLFFVILLLFPGGILLKFEIDKYFAIKEGKINAGYYRDLIGENYETVEAHFESAGFTNITLIDLDDSGLLFWKNEKVDMVSIAGNNTFESTDWFYPTDEVVITYH